MAEQKNRKHTVIANFESGLGNTLNIKFLEVENFPWSVTRDKEDITFKLGKGKKEKEETFKTTEIREFLIKNFNWNGIVNMMHLLEEKSDRLGTYTRPTNLKGIADNDDILIIPDEATEAIIYEQAKYAIETTYKDNPKSKIDDILKYVDGKPKKGFAKDTLSTTYEDLLKEDNNSKMEYDGTTFTMPNLKTVSESDLYDFLRNLALARNGLWSDESEVTNFISIRRDLESNNSKHNDTLFLAWKNGSTKKTIQYIGSTEPGNLTHGQLEPQTTTMVLGFHDTSNATPSGRTRNSYRKSRGSDSLYFQSGDTSMNVHYASHGIHKEGLPKNVTEYGLKNNRDGKNYSDDELSAYLIIIGVLKILSRWGTGKSANKTCAYKNLENICNSFKIGKLEGTTIATKKITIKQNSKVVKTIMLSTYQTYIEANYKLATKKDDAISILMHHDSSLSKADLKLKKQADLVTELKKSDVFQSIVELQLKEEFKLKNIDAQPGKGTITKINKTKVEKEEATKKYNETVEKAEKDNQTLITLFDNWNNNGILGKKTSLKKKFQEKFRINKVDYPENEIVEIGDFGGKSINKKVGGWSDGCQVILGGQHFYEFMYLLTQFVSDSKQEIWYYTLIDNKNI